MSYKYYFALIFLIPVFTFILILSLPIKVNPIEDIEMQGDLSIGVNRSGVKKKIKIKLDLNPYLVNGAIIKEIKQRGVLRVGVKSDYKPWGWINEKGEHVGMEIDMARNIANILGVTIKFVSVSTVFRLQKLDMKEIDLVIATMSGTPERARLAHLIEPPYYLSGVTVLLKKNSSVKNWGSLKDCEICLLRGAYYNRDIIEKYSISKQIYNSTRDVAKALKDGQCIGWAYDDTVLKNLLVKSKWSDYNLPLPLKYPKPWTMAINKDYAGTNFARFLRDIVILWHQSGFLLEREKYHGLPQSQFLVAQNRLFNVKTPGNKYLCSIENNGDLPDECLKYKIIPEEDNNDIPEFMKFLKKAGIDLGFMLEPYNRNLLMEGLTYTISLSVISIFLAMVTGVIFAIIRCGKRGLLRNIVTGCGEFFRLTPPILHLYMIFFGICGYLSLHFNINIDPKIVAILSFSNYAGSAIGGIIEAAMMEYRKKHPDKNLFNQVLKAIDASYENIRSNLINLVKLAGVASVISIPEIISSSNMIVAENGNQIIMMNFLLVFYFLFTGIFIMLLKHGKKAVELWSRKI
ncbi:MAG: ABC transporter permease subunit [Desulfobacterales bacterium]|nr:ABC transporter permease subunit [Desulfobacterales bacterium]